jgi:hypothetical protein
MEVNLSPAWKNKKMQITNIMLMIKPCIIGKTNNEKRIQQKCVFDPSFRDSLEVIIRKYLIKVGSINQQLIHACVFHPIVT